MKYSELEKQIQQEENIYVKSEMIMEITENDDVATSLSKKVIKRDVANLIEKIQGIFQRESAEVRDITNMSEIRQLIEWLEYICED